MTQPDSSASPPLAPQFFRLAAINILSNVTTPLAGIVDVAFLGHLAEVKHLAGVALASVLFDYLYWSFGFLRMATTGLSAQAVGRGDRQEAVLVGVRNGAIAIVVGALILLLQWPIGALGFWLLQGEPAVEDLGRSYFDARVWGALPSLLNYVVVGWFLGQARSGVVLLLTIVGNATNVVLNYYFIAQWGWGAAGAGWGTSLSQFAMVGVGLVCLVPSLRDLCWVKAWPDIWRRSAIAAAFSLNANLMVRTFALMTTFAIFTNIGSLLGTTILAANTLLLQVFILGAYITDGLAFATECLSGILDGRGLRGSLRSLLWLSGISSEVAGVTVALVFAVFPASLLGLLTDRPEVIDTALPFVPWLIPILGLGAFAFMLDGYFLGLTAGSALRNSTMWGTAIGFVPCAAIAVWRQNPHYLWLGLSAFMGVRAGVLINCLPATLKEGERATQALTKSSRRSSPHL